MADDEFMPPASPEHHDAFDITPEVALGDAIRRYRSGELKGSCCLIIHLNKGEAGDLCGGNPYRYFVNHNLAGMRYSEAIALMETLKFMFLKEMFDDAQKLLDGDEGDDWKKD